MTNDIEGLRKVAEEATPGPWYHRQAGERGPHGQQYDWLADRPDRGAHHKILIARESLHGGTPDYAFIATFNPERVLALLSELEAVKGERDDQQAALVLAAAHRLLIAAKRHVATHPVYRSKPVGFEGSAARLEQDDRIATEDELRAAIAAAEGRA